MCFRAETYLILSLYRSGTILGQKKSRIPKEGLAGGASSVLLPANPCFGVMPTVQYYGSRERSLYNYFSFGKVKTFFFFGKATCFFR